MSRLLFSHSYFYRFDPKQWKMQQPYPPLATIQAAAYLRDAGHYVALFDTNLRQHPGEVAAELTKQKPEYFIIYDDGFNYLTKMCLTNMREAACEMATEAKRQGCIVIINSSDASDRYEYYLSNGADYVIRGEGEETLKILIETLNGGGDVAKVDGVSFRNNGGTFSTAARSVLRDLDALPLPAWDLVDIDAYKKIWLSWHGYFSLNLATTRGCPFKCNWCAKPIYGNRYNSRSPEHVVREIEFLIKNYSPDHIWMCDDIFGLKPGWIQSFRDLVREKGLTFRYKIQSRVDLLLQEDTIDALAASGAETVWVGAESGSQKILDAMDKGTTTSQIGEAAKLLREKKIRVGFFLQFGYPGETREDIEKTIAMVLKLMPDEIGISVSYPLPGTKFYERVKDQLSAKQNWSDSDDLSMMYHGTFPPEFYKVLHRYVHNRYGIERGRNAIRLPLRRSSLRQMAAMVLHVPMAIMRGYKMENMYRSHAKGISL
ncbi:MAG TPA: radical SAM protein [Cyclobacteriaceae bacterium]|nr:radical SAM protein [Cyclobacteriaceae bacterium]